MKIKKLLLLPIILLYSAVAFSQCTGGTLDGTIVPTTSWQTVVSHSDEYFKFSATAGNVYIFSYCPCEGGSIGYNAELSLDSTGVLAINGEYGDVSYNDNFCGGAISAPRLSWKCMASGTYRILTTEQFCSATSGLTATLAYITQTPSLCYSVASMSYAPDTYNAGTVIPMATYNNDDGLSNYLNIGFSFCFNGTTYTQLFVTANGYITFKNSCDLILEDTNYFYPPSSYTMENLPFTNTTLTQIIGPAVLFPWIDAYPAPVGGGNIYYKLYGTAPNRHLTISFNKVQMFSCTGKLLTFEVQLFETSNIIQIQADTIKRCAAWTPPGGQGVEGLIDWTGFAALVPPGRNLTTWTADHEAWKFTPSCCPIVLPIQLSNFECSSSDNGIILNWTTATETNNKYFSIQRSTDGINFKTVGTMNGAGNSEKAINYTWTDVYPEEGNNYYRLSQTDFDGNTQTLNNISACNYNGLVPYKIFPNPNNGSFFVYLPASGQCQNLSVTDVVGRVVYNRQFEPMTTPESFSITLPEICRGMYFAIITGNNTSITKKIIVN